jgi:PAS domain S-box-containing protein
MTRTIRLEYSNNSHSAESENINVERGYMTKMKENINFINELRYKYVSETRDESGYMNISDIILNSTDLAPEKELMLQTIQEWKDTFNAITDMITIHDREFNIIYANKAAEKILKLPFSECAARKCFRYYHGADAPPDGCPSGNCSKTGHPVCFEAFEPNLNMFLEIRAVPRFNRNGQVAGTIHIVRDISSRKKIERDLKAATADWESTFDSVPELILIIDRGLNILRCNRRFAKFAGKSPEETDGCKCKDFFQCSGLQAENCMEQIRRGDSMQIEMQTRCGQWFKINHQPVLDGGKESGNTIIVATDITDLKKTQEYLISSKSELQERVRELERFYEMAVDRELRMAGLKKELKKTITALSRYQKDGDDSKERS